MEGIQWSILKQLRELDSAHEGSWGVNRREFCHLVYKSVLSPVALMNNAQREEDELEFKWLYK